MTMQCRNARRIRAHEATERDKAITVLAFEGVPNIPDRHVYAVASGAFWADLKFEVGPADAGGRRGITTESLIAVCIDRLEGFQAGQFSCAENRAALEHLRGALEWLHARTRDRIDRGVEGRAEA